MKTGLELIAEERQEQIEKHGFDVKHDKELYEADELVDAAVFAITGDYNFYPKTWGDWWANKMIAKTNATPHSKIERLRIAGALLAAEIDRLQSGEMPIEKIDKPEERDELGRNFDQWAEDEFCR